MSPCNVWWHCVVRLVPFLRTRLMGVGRPKASVLAFYSVFGIERSIIICEWSSNCCWEYL